MKKCKCYQDPSWRSQETALSAPICAYFEPMDMDRGICVLCEHDEECHAEEAPPIDYRAHCEALAGALEPLTRDAPKGLCTDDLLAHFAEMRRVAVLALTRWQEEGK